MIEVYPCGTLVDIPIAGGIRGHITEVNIICELVSYNVMYFSDGQKQTVWLYEYQFNVSKAAKTPIGFKQLNP